MDRLAPDVRRRLERLLIGPARSRAELLAIGLADRDIRRLLRNGRLRHEHGHYAAAFTAAEYATIKCTQAAFPGAVLSHFTAAALWELRTWVDSERDEAPDTGAVWLTRQPQSSRNETRDDVVVHRAGLPDTDITLRGSAPITNRARTVIDLARELPLRESIVTVDHALRTTVTRNELARAIARQRGWPGIRQARTAVAFADPRSESALESIARAAFATAGLPEPVLQATFRHGDAWMNERVDFWWPEFRTFAEADGLAKYDAPTPAERRALQRAAFVREQGLADLGLEMVRFGFEDAVMTPAELAERIHRAFARGTARGVDIPWRAPDPYDRLLWPKDPPDDL